MLPLFHTQPTLLLLFGVGCQHVAITSFTSDKIYTALTDNLTRLYRWDTKTGLQGLR